jgi:hypothetical protein
MIAGYCSCDMRIFDYEAFDCNATMGLPAINEEDCMKQLRVPSFEAHPVEKDNPTIFGPLSSWDDEHAWLGLLVVGGRFANSSLSSASDSAPAEA